MNTTQTTQKLTKKDFASSAAIRWCPGCGDYAILNAVQRVLAQENASKEKTVFVSGIGCSSRLPYYLSTYGFHTIHGRATSVATGLKLARPDLDVWIVSGDGDSLSIGAGHFVHLIRRNVDVNLLIFNNRIYGLTKGQFSPTSEKGKVTKSSPDGSSDRPLEAVSLAYSLGATFIARSIDTNVAHLTTVLSRAMKNRGTSIVEIYQNCNIFNDGAFSNYTDRDIKENHALWLEDKKPLLFGDKKDRAVTMDNFSPKAVSYPNAGSSVANDNLLHNEQNKMLGAFYNEMTIDPDLPTPFGVFYEKSEKTYEEEKGVFENIKGDIPYPLPEKTRTQGIQRLLNEIKTTDFWSVD